MGMLGGSTESVKGIGKLSGVIRRIPEATEVALVLVGCDDNLKGLAVSFVRLAEGILMPGIAEVGSQVKPITLVSGLINLRVHIDPYRCSFCIRSTGPKLLSNDQLHRNRTLHGSSLCHFGKGAGSAG